MRVPAFDTRPRREISTASSLVTRRRFVTTAAGAVAVMALRPNPVLCSDADPEHIRALDSELFRREWIDVEGLAMHTVISTAADTLPPVVLVHGLALSGRYMLPTAESLAEAHRVYVPDFPGFGDSDKPDRVLNVPRLADALEAWMNAARIERAMFLGNSFGCQIIADLAARFPQRVDRAVLQGPTTPPDERTWRLQYIRWQENSPYNPPSMSEIASEDYRKCGLVRALRTFQFSLNDRVEEKLPHISAPVLVVRGELDPICNQDWAERVVRGLPDGKLAVIPGVAHTLVYTHPRELVAASREFLAEGLQAGPANLSTDWQQTGR